MKILLDNCVDWRVKNLPKDHSVAHCKDLGWANLSNGDLLTAAADADFEAMITVDKKIKYEQNLDRLPLTVIEIDIPTAACPPSRRSPRKSFKPSPSWASHVSSRSARMAGSRPTQIACDNPDHPISDFPLISFGCASPIICSAVGATSASRPPSRSLRPLN